MEFSKKLMVFASLMFAATWGVATFSWFASGGYPEGLAQLATWLYGAALAMYGGKSAYENGIKLHGSGNKKGAGAGHGAEGGRE